MEMSFTLSNAGSYAVDLDRPLDISIPIHFDDVQLSTFGSPPARSDIYEAGDFVGDVRIGGSCNCETYSFSPHLNGTHTEGVGHISARRISIHDIIKETLSPASLITIEPQSAEKSDEIYDPALRPGDLVITKKALEKAVENCDPGFLEALILRTLPNEEGKITRIYGEENPPPFFSIEAMEHINALGLKHLLVDMPSVDRLDDEGKLTNHHIFWGIEPGTHDTDIQNPSRKTITELIYVPDEVTDGAYMLNLQIAAFKADAAPSRPVLYEVSPE